MMARCWQCRLIDGKGVAMLGQHLANSLAQLRADEQKVSGPMLAANNGPTNMPTLKHMLGQRLHAIWEQPLVLYNFQ